MSDNHISGKHRKVGQAINGLTILKISKRYGGDDTLPDSTMLVKCINNHECIIKKDYINNPTSQKCKECAKIKKHQEDTKHIGERFDKLVIIEKIKINNKIEMKCLCDCGIYVNRRYNLLQTNKTNHCGCSRKLPWEGVGEVPARYLAGLILSAKHRDIYFDANNVTLDFLWELFLKQDRKCAISGIDIYFQSKIKKYYPIDWTASLDRIDSNLPYITTNVQWVHKVVNEMKVDYNLKYFINLCKKVSDYDQKKL